MKSPPHATLLIAVGGPPPGPAPGGGKPLAELAVPKGFDPGDSQPGDELDVTCHCRLSADGRSLQILSVDGAGGDEDDEEDGDEEGGGEDGGVSGPPPRPSQQEIWQRTMGRHRP